MNRLSRIKAIQTQVKESSFKSTQFAERVSFGLLCVGPFLGGLPWIFSYLIYKNRVDAPGAMKYAKWSGKLVVFCYLTLIVGYFMGKGEEYLEYLDTKVEEKVGDEP